MGAVGGTLFPGVSAGRGGGGERTGQGSTVAEGRGLISGSASVLRAETSAKRGSAREVGKRVNPGSKSHLSC